MGTQEDPARPGVTPGDVLAVLELARTRLDTMTPVPASWDVIIDQMRAALVERVAGPPEAGGGPQPSESTGSS
jgi:hypothetical protein